MGSFTAEHQIDRQNSNKVDTLKNTSSSAFITRQLKK